MINAIISERHSFPNCVVLCNHQPFLKGNHKWIVQDKNKSPNYPSNVSFIHHINTTVLIYHVWEGEKTMLGDKDAVANIAVKDLETAGKFYEGILGLRKIGFEG